LTFSFPPLIILGYDYFLVIVAFAFLNSD